MWYVIIYTYTYIFLFMFKRLRVLAVLYVSQSPILQVVNTLEVNPNRRADLPKSLKDNKSQVCSVMWTVSAGSDNLYQILDNRYQISNNRYQITDNLHWITCIGSDKKANFCYNAISEGKTTCNIWISIWQKNGF